VGLGGDRAVLILKGIDAKTAEPPKPKKTMKMLRTPKLPPKQVRSGENQFARSE
jgi:hypothetical protein